MVRRKKIQKGCKKAQKDCKKEPQLPCLLCKFYKKTGFSCTFQKIIVYLRHILNIRIMISEKELNSYRLTSMEEPTDEMLAQIMHEAAEIYNRENEDTKKKVINMIREASNQAAHKYQTRYGK